MSLIQTGISKFVVIQSNSRLLIEFSCNLKTLYYNLQCKLNNSLVLEVSQVPNTSLNKRSKAMSKVLKVVFAAFESGVCSF